MEYFKRHPKITLQRCDMLEHVLLLKPSSIVKEYFVFLDNTLEDSKLMNEA